MGYGDITGAKSDIVRGGLRASVGLNYVTTKWLPRPRQGFGKGLLYLTLRDRFQL